MSEIRDVAEALDGLRIFLNAYGDSDLTVIAKARSRILNLIDERESSYEQLREARRAASSETEDR